MNTAVLDEILKLPVPERLGIVKTIWDSIAGASTDLDVSDELRAELNARLEVFRSDPEGGYAWDEARARMTNGTWRTA